MNKKSKKLSNPFSAGGGGGHFEAHVQASFVALMLTGGYAPCLPCWPITEIKLQGKIDGFDTDDLIIFIENDSTEERQKLLGQVKHSISITKASPVLSEVIQAAWNDFNNPNVFAKDKDIIALITGPLSATDFHNVQWLLAQSRHTKNADEFYRNVEQANFSPAKSLEKLNVIKHHLKLANNDSDVSRDELYSFLNHFYLLGYDLGKEVGVVLSLLHSHISQFNQETPQWVWSRVVDIVQTWNQDSGTIVLEKLPQDLKDVFKQPVIAHIPKELITIQPESVKMDWSKHQYATELALANLIGAWNEKQEADTLVLENLTAQSYLTWILKAREVLHLPNSPFSLLNGIWKATERGNLWDALGSYIFDQHLDTFKKCAVAVLTERDPSFDLPTEKRFAANIYGKVFTHSSALRMGLAEGLAIIGNKPSALIHCSQGKAESTAVLAIREILIDSDWVLWGSLNNLLPVLAEAAPDEFLDAVENALRLSPCPFKELFSQEGNGITGRSYLTGLLWALESLAWDEKYLVCVCIILGQLCNHDPGGSWANRPNNSLVTILLPWHPQTIASVNKRTVAVQTLSIECPEVVWKLIIKLLPNQHQTSIGSHKPLWHNTIPENWKEEVTRAEYREQVLFYSELAISMSNNDATKLGELINHFDDIPNPSFDKLLEVLLSDKILGFSEDERLHLWDRLKKLTTKHRRFSDAEWALKDELLSPIEAVAEKLAPSNPFYLYQYLFSNGDFDLYEENGNWEEQRIKLDECRQKAVEKIFELGGIELVIQFAEAVESEFGQVGHPFGRIANEEIDRVLIPKYLKTENRKLSSFIRGYVWSRYYTNGWSWVDELDKSGWDIGQICQFLCYLPFTSETWIRAEQWLGNSQGEYWLKTNVNPYPADEALNLAIEKLIEYERPLAAINCLVSMRHENQLINSDLCVKALLAALSSRPSDSMDIYNVVELIKVLQENSQVLQDDLFQVEWAYLPLLDRHDGATPKVLENRLALTA